jgi:hypothetical protein
MNKEKQRITIAEACGWTEILRPCDEAYHDLPTDTLGLVMGRVCGIRPGGIHIENAAPLPEYLNDLNAMHEAEKVLTYEQAEEFVEQLYLADQKNNLAENPPPWRFNVASATSAQRAEAFLKTIGKWEDDK